MHESFLIKVALCIILFLMAYVCYQVSTIGRVEDTQWKTQNALESLVQNQSDLNQSMEDIQKKLKALCLQRAISKQQVELCN